MFLVQAIPSEWKAKTYLGKDFLKVSTICKKVVL